ncbi:acetate--CoA ligase [Deinococcus wulumuqiensis]|uniref:Acetyl-coenzyme A synthetase n=1 Tax=Deinococcus wulumuqiensis TaxID=980427 RepID=A0AAV4K7U6_9DEIO|nr:acetate--CoA ligase [Deinococcus wulumuqiensis]QII21447.1 acetate--CoA ligase [Deinococcus wulumuqiensis R12]GGI85146.1 acetyl-coenzyme A synthetase [Deinococcus wulumuqiensis]GGP29931.1 acetyl-coenzyme A synthetase [Deinococcus wulumuqiensis]
MSPASDHIDAMLHETRVIPPSAEFQSAARVSREAYERRYRQSLDQPDEFWSEVARDLHWMKEWDRVLDWQEPHAQWFVGGQTNIAYNALDRNVQRGLGDKRAIIWEGEDGRVRTYTYAELLREVCKAANALEELGVVAGDRVTLYMPLIPEAAIAMLACARIGAVHSVVFGGFSVSALADRINNAQSKLLITADAGYRRGKPVTLKINADEAAKLAPCLEHILVVKHTGIEVEWWTEGRDLWWHDVVDRQSDRHEAAALDSEHPLFILYTSGSTGTPKGVQHTTGGYMVSTYLTTQTVFDLRDDDIYWCTADIGWITGHSYSVYGPLLNGATVVMYEGAPNQPDWGRFWDIVQKHRITILYTAPTAIRSFMQHGEEIPGRYDLSSLRLLGSVGEPINPEAWMWYYRVIGGERCPVVDTWWQTETGSIMLTTLPGAFPSKPGSAGLPMFGIEPALMTREGEELGADDGGLLVIKRPWPSMLRTVYGDDERYRKSYWGEIQGVYFAGDGARRDADGYYTIVGRVDDVLNVSGHRLGTMEIESALVAHPDVSEAAVVGKPDPVKGEAVVAYVLLQDGHTADPAALRAHVTREIGALARPDAIYIADALPKTRSGKIMRRFLRQLAAGQTIQGDTSTLEDPAVLDRLAVTQPL